MAAEDLERTSVGGVAKAKGDAMPGFADTAEPPNVGLGGDVAALVPSENPLVAAAAAAAAAAAGLATAIAGVAKPPNVGLGGEGADELANENPPTAVPV